MSTPDFVNEKHRRFDQGLDVRIFYQGNREKAKESIRTHTENLRGPGPSVLLRILLLYPMNQLKNKSGQCIRIFMENQEF